MPMYPEIMVVPMREELTRLGIAELRSAEEVDQALKNRPGTTMVVVNSICGCAAGRMRPAVRMALQNSIRPDKAFSVFAGQDTEATERARSYFTAMAAVVALDCYSARWKACLHDAAARHRVARSPSNCRRSEGSVRPVLREGRSGSIVSARVSKRSMLRYERNGHVVLRQRSIYFFALSMNDFTTMAFGCSLPESASAGNTRWARVCADCASG